MNSVSNPESFAQIRRIYRVDNLESDINMNESMIKQYFLFLLEDFPNQNLEDLKKQLDYFFSLLTLMREKKLPPTSLTYIQESNFPNVLFSLIMNESLDPIMLKHILPIFQIFTYDTFSPQNYSTLMSENFLNRFLVLLQSHDISKDIITQCLSCLINILQFVPNSLYFFNKAGITQYIAINMINSDHMPIFSESTRYILLAIQTTTNNELKNLLLNQVFSALIGTMKIRPLTYLLQTALNCMTKDANTRILFVEGNICQKCVDVIKMMKEINQFSQYYGDYAMQILALISNLGSEQEFQTLLNSNVFEILFEYKYSFLDISPMVCIANDSYKYVCSFLSGVFSKNNPNTNQLINQYEIFPQICYVLLHGPSGKRLSSLYVIASAVEFRNVEFCQYLLKDDIISTIIEMLTLMTPDILKITIMILQKIFILIPNAKEIYLANDLVPKLELLVLQESSDDELIAEVENLLKSFQED